jgi:hypothetical protein
VGSTVASTLRRLTRHPAGPTSAIRAVRHPCLRHWWAGDGGPNVGNAPLRAHAPTPGERRQHADTSQRKPHSLEPGQPPAPCRSSSGTQWRVPVDTSLESLRAPPASLPSPSPPAVADSTMQLSSWLSGPSGRPAKRQADGSPAWLASRGPFDAAAGGERFGRGASRPSVRVGPKGRPIIPIQQFSSDSLSVTRPAGTISMHPAGMRRSTVNL